MRSIRLHIVRPLKMCFRVFIFFGGNMNISEYIKSFTKFEKGLWLVSVLVITVSFLVSGGGDYLSLTASLIGVTSLIFNAKGNPVGQLLMVIFSALYSVISYSFRYYGEMITYLGMTMPMAVFALISWLKNPYDGNKSEVRVDSIGKREAWLMCIATGAVTAAFYFILRYFHTANIVPSTISVTTSFLAAYLTFRRNPYFALAYAANDVVLIVLWAIASAAEIRYLSVVVCFLAFFANDVYGFINWRKMKIRQDARKS